MLRIGYEAYVLPDKMVSVARHTYVPYIFSEKELKSLFSAVDNVSFTSLSPYRHLVLPLIFRILYGCGLRVSEAVNLKISDVNLEKGILLIHQAKLNKERVVPMTETLIGQCRNYSRQVHGSQTQTPYYFPSPLGNKYSTDCIYEYFRRFLWDAGISHGGRGQGPRLQDLRHTYSVHCLKKWVKNGNDLTNLLPYLSAYLGHVDLRSSQYYLRLTADLYPNLLAAVETHYPNLIPEVASYETD
jgi:integrase